MAITRDGVGYRVRDVGDSTFTYNQACANAGGNELHMHPCCGLCGEYVCRFYFKNVATDYEHLPLITCLLCMNESACNTVYKNKPYYGDSPNLSNL